MAERLMPENRAHHQNIKQCHKYLKNSSASRAKLETNVTTSMMAPQANFTSSLQKSCLAVNHRNTIMQHRRLKQKHWSNTNCGRKNLNSLAENSTCHITTNSTRSNTTEENFTTTTQVSSKLQNFSSNLLYKQHSQDEEEENSNTTSHCNVSQSSPYLFHFLVLVLLTFAQYADGCSSRSTPKPRPPSHSAMRPNITFQTYACPPAYAAWYCLNGATCFTVKIADSILYNCECADGYMGQRCEFKDLDGTYLPTRERLLMGMGLLGRSSSKVGPVLLAVLFIIVAAAIVSFIITKSRTNAKKARILKHHQQQSTNNSSSSDTISHIDCPTSPNSGNLPIPSLYPVNHYGYCSDLTVLGQTISYSLSRDRYPNIEHQGTELRSIHDPNHTMMVSSRIPARNLNYST